MCLQYLIIIIINTFLEHWIPLWANLPEAQSALHVQLKLSKLHIQFKIKQTKKPATSKNTTTKKTLNYDPDFRIFDVSTQSFNAHLYMHVFAFIDSVRLNGCWEGRLGLEPLFFFHLGGPLGPFYEILEATLQLGKYLTDWDRPAYGGLHYKKTLLRCLINDIL